jgi:outer membrane murein-binding lipoprotein Lpp
MSRLSTLLGAALLVGGLMVSPAWSQQKKNDAVAEAAVKEAVAQVARLQSARDSLSRLRWSLRQTGLDARERWQAEQDGVRDSLDKAATERTKLLEDIRETRERAAQVKPGPDALLNVEPPFLALHDDPRFQQAVRRIGIPSPR